MTAADSQLHSVREGVRSLQFFVAAMAAQLHDMHDRVNQVEAVAGPVEGGQPSGVAQLTAERDAAREEATGLRERVGHLERQVEVLQEELQRRHITFEDHHAAKQELTELRTEVERLRSHRGDDEPLSLRKRWSLSRP
jgi:chromosome segregation ATPase